jgi:hypothetical protein
MSPYRKIAQLRDGTSASVPERRHDTAAGASKPPAKENPLNPTW